MPRRDPLWLSLIRHLAVVLLAAPLIGSIGVWVTVAVLIQISPDRIRILEMGNRAMAMLIGFAALGLIGEFLIVPLLLGERSGRRRRFQRAKPAEDMSHPR